MKRRNIIFLFILFFVGLKLEAQYKKFNFDTIFYWKQFNDFYQGPTFNQNSTYQIKKVKDTIINFKTYHKIGPFGGQTCGPQGCYPWFQNGLLWHDTIQRRIYYLYNNTDVLLYDFSLSPGDTLKNAAACVGGGPYVSLRLTKIDSTILNDGKYYRRHIFDWMPPGPISYTVTESIGSNVGLMTPYYANANGQDWLICYGKINPYFNIYWNQGLCGIISTHVGDYFERDNSGLIIFPNPIQKKFSVATNVDLLWLEVYDVNGKKIISKNTLEEIDVTELQSGFLLIKAYTKNGNVLSKKLIKE